MKTSQRHVHQRDTSIPADHWNRTWCLCGRREDHPAHKVPEQDEDTGAIERRRLGEKESD